MIVTAKSDSENIRIYVDDTLHIRIPRDKNIKIHSWVEDYTKLYSIEVWCLGHSVLYQYEDKKLWEDVLNAFNKHI